jgi:hypothetical protein
MCVVFPVNVFLISGVGLWVLRPLTGLLYQPLMIGDFYLFIFIYLVCEAIGTAATPGDCGEIGE